MQQQKRTSRRRTSCVFCNKPMVSKRRHKMYCSPVCKVNAHREKHEIETFLNGGVPVVKPKKEPKSAQITPELTPENIEKVTVVDLIKLQKDKFNSNQAEK